MISGIDSANLFGAGFTFDCIQEAGCYRATWDNELWLLHKGLPASTEGDLIKILAACRDQPPVAGAPVGWLAFGRHVDDGAGVDSSDALVEWLRSQVASPFSLGYEIVASE